MLHLSLAENGLYHNLQNLIIDLESFRLFLDKVGLGEKLSVADEHFTEFRNLLVQVVWSDLVELQAHFLYVVLLPASLFHVLRGKSVHAHLQFILVFPPRVVVDGLLDRSTCIESFSAGWASVLSVVAVVAVVVTTTASTATATTSSVAVISMMVVVAAFARGSGHLLVNELLGLALLATLDQAAVDACLNQIFGQFWQIAQLADEGVQKVKSHFLCFFDIFEGAGEAFD